jgi:hypothetical protein
MRRFSLSSQREAIVRLALTHRRLSKKEKSTDYNYASPLTTQASAFRMDEPAAPITANRDQWSLRNLGGNTHYYG